MGAGLGAGPGPLGRRGAGADGQLQRGGRGQRVGRAEGHPAALEALRPPPGPPARRPRSARRWPTPEPPSSSPAVRVVESSTASGSTRWSNTATSTGWTGVASDRPITCATCGAGVANDEGHGFSQLGAARRAGSGRDGHGVFGGGREPVDGTGLQFETEGAGPDPAPPAFHRGLDDDRDVGLQQLVEGGELDHGLVEGDAEERGHSHLTLGLEARHVQRSGRWFGRIVIGGWRGREGGLHRVTHQWRSQRVGWSVEVLLVVGVGFQFREAGQHRRHLLVGQHRALDHRNLAQGGRESLALAQSDAQQVTRPQPSRGRGPHRTGALCSCRRHPAVSAVVALEEHDAADQNRQPGGDRRHGPPMLLKWFEAHPVRLSARSNPNAVRATGGPGVLQLGRLPPAAGSRQIGNAAVPLPDAAAPIALSRAGAWM